MGRATSVQNRIINYTETPVTPAQAGIYETDNLDSHLRGND
jgi:hypothetical protein